MEYQPHKKLQRIIEGLGLHVFYITFLSSTWRLRIQETLMINTKPSGLMADLCAKNVRPFSNCKTC